MKRLQIGQSLGVGLGLLATLGLYQSLANERPEAFSPGQTEFRSLAEFQQLANQQPTSGGSRLAQFDESDPDDNQIQLPATVPLSPAELELAPELSLGDEDDSTEQDVEIALDLDVAAPSSDKHLAQLQTPTEALPLTAPEASPGSRYSDVPGSTWKSNPFLNEKQGASDPVAKYLDAVEIRADAVHEPEPQGKLASIDVSAKTVEIAGPPTRAVSSKFSSAESASMIHVRSTQAHPAAVRSDDLPTAKDSVTHNTSILDLTPPESEAVEIHDRRRESQPESKEMHAEPLRVAQREMETTLSESQAVPPQYPPEAPAPSKPFTPVNEYTVPTLGLGLNESVAQRAAHHVEYGKTLARRGATHVARQEFFSALRVLAQAGDEKLGTNQRSQALKRAIIALKEAEDFMIHDTETQIGLDTGLVVETHTSGILNQEDAKNVSPVRAMQLYLATAQRELQIACGRNVVSSEVLHGLGKLHSMSSEHISTSGRLDVAKAIVYHRAALGCDANNHRSANELGVLLARAGQLEEAKLLFKQSLRCKATPQTWRNLAKVHARLGEKNLADLARSEYDRLLRSPIDANDGRIQWVNAQRFNATAPLPTHKMATESPAKPASSGQKESKSIGQRLKDLF
jgi:tetratricopeptide (TPR) repeat protein